MNSSRWMCVAKTDVGTVRKVNEDNYLDCCSAGLWCVADGMGGHARGDVASQLIIEGLSKLIDASKSESKSPLNLQQISECIQSVNSVLIQLSKRHDSIVGSTVAILFIQGAKVYCIWAGDSRIYRLRDRYIFRMTRDHSQVEDMVDAGLISASEAEHHPKANIITRAVGAHEELKLEIASFDLDDDDRFLVCSDGLNKVMSDQELESFILEHPFADAADALIDIANKRNARDNVTAILVQNETFDETLLNNTLPLDSTLPLGPR
ncbi:PP2C family protein-serine/threonine phosphatase [Ningiella sp. W23]|uniref:PP2C family protein-serine/threonine phosphatase n=1 Tax=Ningiella sp. W23 TaxID=3023715 RepID=UPI00375715A4